jgi:hypothetical protein
MQTFFTREPRVLYASRDSHGAVPLSFRRARSGLVLLFWDDCREVSQFFENSKKINNRENNNNNNNERFSLLDHLLVPPGAAHQTYSSEESNQDTPSR